MALGETISRVLARNVGEHKRLVEESSAFDKSMIEKDLESLFIRARSTVMVMQRDLLEHFKMEEELFFPAAVMGANDMAVTRMVLQLQRDHANLEHELRHLTGSLNKETLNTEFVSKEELGLFRDFMRQLQAHSRIELEKLFPVLQENKNCQALLRKLHSPQG
jgi:iron-sulfur cluster repair protein YtfE (RIC family)